MQSKVILKKCLHTPPWEWEWNNLNNLKSEEIAGLCKIMGISHSGTKNEKIYRLKTASDVRHFLHNQSLESLQALPKKLLAQNAKKAGTPSYLNKYGIAAALINWRSECQRKGKEIVRQSREYAKTQPKQLSLF